MEVNWPKFISFHPIFWYILDMGHLRYVHTYNLFCLICPYVHDLSTELTTIRYRGLFLSTCTDC